MIADSKATATVVLGDKVIGDLDPGGVGDGVTTGREHGTGFKASKPGGGPGGVKVGESIIDLAGVTGGGVGDGGALKGAHAGGGPSGVYEGERIVALELDGVLGGVDEGEALGTDGVRLGTGKVRG